MNAIQNLKKLNAPSVVFSAFSGSPMKCDLTHIKTQRDGLGIGPKGVTSYCCLTHQEPHSGVRERRELESDLVQESFLRESSWLQSQFGVTN